MISPRRVSPLLLQISQSLHPVTDSKFYSDFKSNFTGWELSSQTDFLQARVLQHRPCQLWPSSEDGGLPPTTNLTFVSQRNLVSGLQRITKSQLLATRGFRTLLSFLFPWPRVLRTFDLFTSSSLKNVGYREERGSTFTRRYSDIWSEYEVWNDIRLASVDPFNQILLFQAKPRMWWETYLWHNIWHGSSVKWAEPC